MAATRIMTDDEVMASFMVDEFAMTRASEMASQVENLDFRVIDAVRVYLCELCFKEYLVFSNKFNVGDAIALRKLLDECWERIHQGASLPLPESVRDILNSAEFDWEDWDHPLAGKAVAALCIMDASLVQSIGARLAGLRAGLEALMWNVAHDLIDRAGADDSLVTLPQALKSGAVLFPVGQPLVTVLEAAQSAGNSPETFAKWAHKSIT